ncbi:MAG: hypothetical protein ACSI46_27650 [Gloeotrichia echinulata DVL01]|nr:hypothetical protein [Gloeotrichia echinulata DEX184]
MDYNKPCKVTEIETWYATRGRNARSDGWKVRSKISDTSNLGASPTFALYKVNYLLDFTNSRNNNRAACAATFILTSLTGCPAAFSRSKISPNCLPIG